MAKRKPKSTSDTQAPRRGRGRPPADDPKLSTTVRFNGQEAALIQSAAALDHLAFAPWIRQAALRTAEERLK